MAIEVFYFNKAALMDEAARAFILDLNLKNCEDAVSTTKFKLSLFWNKLPMSFYDMKPEEIFSLLNSEDNPFGSEKKQEWIRANGVSHTSMSVGDVIHITSKVIDRAVNRLDRTDEKTNDRWLICVGAGFAKLEFVEVVA